jgi:sterol desaturase/sphingolipid hydroxylase (fatty acid hydroxylase superfamily)
MVFILEPLHHVFRLSIFTIFLGFFLDTTLAINSTLQLIKKSPELYLQGIMANYLNLFLLSPIYYIGAYNLILDNQDLDFHVLKYLSLILIHHICYHFIHQWMHEIYELKWIHTFHHTFTLTTPTSGNAVTLYEFQLAYVLPFLIGGFITQPNLFEFDLSIGTISLFNLLIHTKELEFLEYPDYFVSPKDHLMHHEIKSKTYSAPIFNIGYFFKKKNE